MSGDAVVHTVIVIAKEPLPGRVKTRLVPPLTHDRAAELAGAALRDTMRSVADVPHRELLLAFDGDPAGWLPAGWRHVAQPHGGLDERLAAAFDAAADGPAVLVGMDTPQLRADQLTAWDPHRYDACLGPAADGGFWALGLADPRRASAVLVGIPMSTGHTGRDQLDRMTGLGLRVQLLDTLTDVDTVADAHEVARLAPDTTFAAALSSMGTASVGMASMRVAADPVRT